VIQKLKKLKKSSDDRAPKEVAHDLLDEYNIILADHNYLSDEEETKEKNHPT